MDLRYTHYLLAEDCLDSAENIAETHAHMPEEDRQRLAALFLASAQVHATLANCEKVTEMLAEEHDRRNQVRLTPEPDLSDGAPEIHGPAWVPEP